MFERTLPVGSIVRLIGANKRIMILGYAKKGKEKADQIFDYAGCIYPEGFGGRDALIVFNHEDIERIYALGYQGEERFEFEKQLREGIDKVKPFEKK